MRNISDPYVVVIGEKRMNKIVQPYRVAIVLLVLNVCISLFCAHSPEPVPSAYPGVEERVFRLVNDYRRDLALRPLLWNEIIAGECRKHSRRLSESDRWLGHDGFHERATVIRRWVRFSEAGENLASNSGKDDPALAAFIQWLESPTHRATMEGDFHITGIGVARSSSGHYYFTQIFIQPLYGRPGLDDFPDYRESNRSSASRDSDIR